MQKVKVKNKYITEERSSLILCVIVFAMYSMVYMSKNCFAAAIAAIVNEGFMTKSQTGLIIAMFWFFYAIFQVPGGIISNKFKPELLVFIGVAGSAVVNLSLYFFHNYYAMMIIWSLNAVIQFGVWPSTFKILSRQLHKNHRDVASYYIPMTFILGLGISYLIAAVVKRWQDNFLVSAVLLIIGAVLFIVTYKLIENKGAFTEEESITEEKKKANNSELINQLVKSGVIILIPAFAIQLFVSNGIKVYAPVMLMELFPSLSVSVSNILGGIISISTALGILFLNIFYPKRIKSSTVTISIMFEIALAMCLVLIFAQKINWTIFMLITVIALIPLTSITQFVNVIIPRKFAFQNLDVQVAGILNSVASFGILISSYGVGLLSDNFNWTVIFIIFSILLFSGIVLTFFANKNWNNFANEN